MVYHATLLLLLSWFAQAPQTQVEVTEWEVPWENTQPRDPYYGSGNQIWFVGQRGDCVGLLDPETGDFKRYDLDDGAGPHSVITGPEGYVWYSGNRAAHIGRLDPKTGEIKKFPMPNPDARDPHTMFFDPTGSMWFTVQGGNFVGRLTPRLEEISLIKVPTARARPYGIVVNSRGIPWVVEFGTNKIASIDPQTLELTEHELPNPNSRPRRMALTSDDMVWYVDYARGLPRTPRPDHRGNQGMGNAGRFRIQALRDDFRRQRSSVVFRNEPRYESPGRVRPRTGDILQRDRDRQRRRDCASYGVRALDARDLVRDGYEYCRPGSDSAAYDRPLVSRKGTGV